MNGSDPEVSARAREIVRECTVLSAASALIPAPIICTTAVTGVHLEMLIDLSKLYGKPFHPPSLRIMLLAAAGGGVTDVVIRMRWVQRLVSAIAPVIIPIWFIGGAAMAGAFTHLLGYAFIRHYEAGGTYRTFDWNEFRRGTLKKAGALVSGAGRKPVLTTG
ncbi:MAG TPA: hypothetical protein VGL42_10970 [Opitutaceae bacterium]|jgi:uncharacterized protein (DUF697 family)